MKRVFAFFFLLFLLPAFLESQTAKKTDRELDGLSGRVKSIEVRTAAFAKDSLSWIEGPSQPSKSSTYDEAGNRTLSVEYGTKGKVKSRTAATFGESGKTVEFSLYDDEGNLQTRYVDSYDADGNFTEGRGFNPDGSLD
jgi:hypothetical protein